LVRFHCPRSTIVQGVKKTDGAKPSKNVGKFKKVKKNKHKKNKSKDQSSGKEKKSFKCHRCGGANYIAKKYKNSPTLGRLGQQSLNWISKPE
jgi:hypothetical protein